MAQNSNNMEPGALSSFHRCPLQSQDPVRILCVNIHLMKIQDLLNHPIRTLARCRMHKDVV